jgi:hypothetical protein
VVKELVVLIKPRTSLEKPVCRILFARLQYTREVPSEDTDDTAPKTINLPGSRRMELDGDGKTTIHVDDYADGTSVVVQIEFAQGSILYRSNNLSPSHNNPAELLAVIPNEVYATASQRVVSTSGSPNLLRTGRFVRLDDTVLDMTGYRLYVAPILPNQLSGGRTNPQTDVVRGVLGLSGTGEVTTFEAVQLDLEKLDVRSLNTLGFQLTTVRPDGAFDISANITGDETAWLWLLIGETSYAGYQLDPTPTQSRGNIVIILPLPAASSSSAAETTVSVSSGTTETQTGSEELLSSLDNTERPQAEINEQKSDNPGDNAALFDNSHRILGERRFFTVLRIDQPEIGGQGSLTISRPISLDVAPPIRFTSIISQSKNAASDTTLTTSRDKKAANSTEALTLNNPPIVLSRINALRAKITSIAQPRSNLRATLGRSIFKPSMDFWKWWVRDRSKDRELVSGHNPIEWEGDPCIYQAASVAGGHVLEWRVRWRSNGYSFGNVAHTLSLAPRQTKRISKITWRRREQAARRESTEVLDALTQVSSRERDYNDAVQSSLSEWSHGESKSRTTGVAGGLGFQTGSVIIGGGVSHGSASSSSSQSGGRRVAAAEHQELRDAIRQYGESSRRLESTVVTEVTQEEEVEGVSETLRNINYCHSLNVIYYEILKHLRVDTEFAGVRECLFVPFSITPFDIDKALKWREQLRQGMLDRDLTRALDYLDEIESDWVDSRIPDGPRMDQPINYVTGSVYIQLSIERPREMDKEETMDAYTAVWTPLAPILGLPVKQILERLKNNEREKDAYYQREVAPTMAIRWANRLTLKIGETAVDFTLASKYNFGSTVRIDFSAPVSNITRSQLLNLTLLAAQPLPAGSVANVKSMKLHYFTNNFNYCADSVPTTNDLIDPTNGTANTDASLLLPLTPWEKQNQRREIEDRVEKLIAHLNSNLVYYHKVIWWLMDRDELYMLLDGFTAPYGRRYENGAWVEDTGRSIASIVERDPLAIMGNTLVMRVAAGAFLGIDGHDSPDAAYHYYYDSQSQAEPIHVSLPTEGLYAQAIMDKNNATEEHYGGTDWVLTNGEPELEALADQLGTRRQAPTDLTPSQMPQTLINLPTVQAVPEPTGLAGVLQAVTNSNAFRDMAGLAGTQANAMKALTATASMAQSFGQMAVDLEKSKQGTADAKQKLSNIKKAQQEGLIDEPEAKRQAVNALADQNMMTQTQKLTQEDSIKNALDNAGKTGRPIEATRQTKDGFETIKVGEEAEEGAGTFKYDAPGIVPIIPQPSINTCWAAVSTMMVSWRDQKSYEIKTVMDMAGTIYRTKFETNKKLSSSEKNLFLPALGLVGELPMSYTVDGLLYLLRAYGPLWATTDEKPGAGFSIHARIITGMYGDGTIDGTKLRIIDPSGGRQYTESFLAFTKKFEEVAATGPIMIQIVHF